MSTVQPEAQQGANANRSVRKKRAGVRGKPTQVTQIAAIITPAWVRNVFRPFTLGGLGNKRNVPRPIALKRDDARRGERPRDIDDLLVFWKRSDPFVGVAPSHVKGGSEI